MSSFLNPEEVLKQLDLRDDMVAADFGCGSGGWVIPLAKKLTAGRVYAIDILNEPLSVLKTKTEASKLVNIKPILADVENVKELLDNSCDLVLMTNLLFQCTDKKKVISEGKRVLKNNGLILIVDWRQGTRLGPQENYVSPAEIKKIAQELDLKIEREFDIEPYHYGIILKKE